MISDLPMNGRTLMKPSQQVSVTEPSPALWKGPQACDHFLKEYPNPTKAQILEELARIEAQFVNTERSLNK
jgi:hypothetical protein